MFLIDSYPYGKQLGAILHDKQLVDMKQLIDGDKPIDCWVTNNIYNKEFKSYKRRLSLRFEGWQDSLG